mmetsp:Transcript_51977/g.122940  ORF Transcript_51977/g.122940 Transcript_51977/m.122940 type:complete len:266 (+) Transcript_51977:203-1000(+)
MRCRRSRTHILARLARRDPHAAPRACAAPALPPRARRAGSAPRSRRSRSRSRSRAARPAAAGKSRARAPEEPWRTPRAAPWRRSLSAAMRPAPLPHLCPLADPRSTAGLGSRPRPAGQLVGALVTSGERVRSWRGVAWVAFVFHPTAAPAAAAPRRVPARSLRAAARRPAVRVRAGSSSSPAGARAPPKAPRSHSPTGLAALATSVPTRNAPRARARARGLANTLAAPPPHPRDPAPSASCVRASSGLARSAPAAGTCLPTGSRC